MDNHDEVQPGSEQGPGITLLDLLASWEPIDDEFPDVRAGLVPLRDVTL